MNKEKILDDALEAGNLPGTPSECKSILHAIEATSQSGLTISRLIRSAWEHAESKGFHKDTSVTFGDRIALIHSEVSEALEAYRIEKSLREWKNGKKPEGVPSELADVVIRVADLCGVYGIDLETAVIEKMEYNKTREYMHGKKF